MSDRTFVDTNVLVYLYDKDEPQKRQRAREVFEPLARADDAILSTQVLKEFYVTVTRKLGAPLSSDDALRMVRDLAELEVVPMDTALVVEGIELSRRHQISLWDALIIVAALQSGCRVLLTEDLQDGWEVGELEVRNPFA